MKFKIVALAAALLATGGAVAQANDTLAKVKSSGVVTMGVRESSGALSYTLGDGKFTGYHIEICQRILANLEKAAERKLEVKYQPVTSQNRIPLVQNGTVDIECGSTTNNAARQKDVAFVVTTYVEEVRIAVKAESGIKSIPDLNGKTIAWAISGREVCRNNPDPDCLAARAVGPLPPGEYGVVEFTEGKLNIQVWDFAVKK